MSFKVHIVNICTCIFSLIFSIRSFTLHFKHCCMVTLECKKLFFRPFSTWQHLSLRSWDVFSHPFYQVDNLKLQHSSSSISIDIHRGRGPGCLPPSPIPSTKLLPIYPPKKIVSWSQTNSKSVPQPQDNIMFCSSTMTIKSRP